MLSPTQGAGDTARTGTQASFSQNTFLLCGASVEMNDSVVLVPNSLSFLWSLIVGKFIYHISIFTIFRKPLAEAYKIYALISPSHLSVSFACQPYNMLHKHRVHNKRLIDLTRISEHIVSARSMGMKKIQIDLS